MTFDPVPWAIGGGAVSPIESARLLAHLASNGGAGVVGPSDLKVKPLSPAAGGVAVGKGAGAALNRFAGVDGGQQSYLLRNPGDHGPVTINPTPSGSGRSDLVAVIIEDPQYAGQPAPASVANGPYVRVRVYEGVAANVTTLEQVAPGQAGLALARVDIPANTGTITAAMIKNLRELLTARSEPFLAVVNPTATANMPTAAYGDWIGGVVGTQVPIPRWANRVTLSGTVSGAKFNAPGAGGAVRVRLGADIFTEPVAFDLATAIQADRVQALMAGQSGLVVPASIRGTTQSMWFQGWKTSGSAITSDVWVMARLEAIFYEAPE